MQRYCFRCAFGDRLVDHLADVAVGGDAGPVPASTFRGTTPPRLPAAAAASSVVGGDDYCCYCCCCCRKTFGPGCYSGDTPARSKGRSYRCKLVALAGGAAVDAGSAGVMIAVAVACSGLFGRSVGPGNRCFAFGVLDLPSGSWTYW